MKRALGAGCLSVLAAVALSAPVAWIVGGHFFPATSERVVRVASASREVADDEPLEGGALAELVLPERLTHRAMIPSGDAPRLVGRVVAALNAGQVLTWTHLADRVRPRRIDACTKAVGEVLEPELTKAAQGVLAQVVEAPAREEELPRGEVLVLARDVQQGAKLVEEDLASVRVPEELLTTSWIGAAHRAEVIGQRVLTRLDPGEPLWWQMLDDGGAPDTLATCRVQIDAAKAEVRERLAPAAAAAWIEEEAKSW